MLKKLYKYDLKNLSKVLLPFCFSLLGAGLLCCALFFLAAFVPEPLMTLLMLPYIFLIFGIFIGGAVGSLYPYLYYYRSFFTDTAYLTFAFPATVKTQLHSKLLSGITYTVLTTLATVVSVFFAMFGIIFAVADGTGIAELISLFGDFFSLMPGFGVASFVTVIIYVIISPLSQMMLAYTVITLGSLLFTKHKVVGSIIFYFVANWSVSIIRTIVSVIFAIPLAAIDASVYLFVNVLVELLLTIGIFIGTYFLTRHMLTHKLNLE